MKCGQDHFVGAAEFGTRRVHRSNEIRPLQIERDVDSLAPDVFCRDDIPPEPPPNDVIGLHIQCAPDRAAVSSEVGVAQLGVADRAAHVARAIDGYIHMKRFRRGPAHNDPCISGPMARH